MTEVQKPKNRIELNEINKGNDSMQNLKAEIKNNENSENKMDNLLTKIQKSILTVEEKDDLANSIPLGAFCFAISFILSGLHDCKIHESDDPLLNSTILLFGGVGQITTGIFEYIKSRTYPSALYFLYGLYFISLYFGKTNENYFTDKNQRFFYGSWACLTLPIYISSFKTNIFLSIQNLSIIGFFIIKCIGVIYDISYLKGIVSGILEMVSGFISLYICFGQILNEHFKFQLFPAVPFTKVNEIDDMK